MPYNATIGEMKANANANADQSENSRANRWSSWTSSRVTSSTGRSLTAMCRLQVQGWLPASGSPGARGKESGKRRCEVTTVTYHHCGVGHYATRIGSACDRCQVAGDGSWGRGASQPAGPALGPLVRVTADGSAGPGGHSGAVGDRKSTRL